MTRSARARVAAIALVLAVGVGTTAAGCAGSKDDGGAATGTTAPSGERKLTEEQRVQFSQILVKNHDAKGATIDVTLQPTGATMRVEIDWDTGLAHGTIDNDGQKTEIYWSTDELLDGTVEGLTAELDKAGEPGVRFVSRPLDPTYSQLDSLASLLNALSATQRENPVALQDQDIAYLGAREVDGRSVDVYRFGKRVTYLVDPATGEMVGIDATFASFPGTAEIRVRERGPQTVRGPKTAEVVDGAAIADLYQRLVGKPLPSGALPGTSTTIAP